MWEVWVLFSFPYYTRTREKDDAALKNLSLENLPGKHGVVLVIREVLHAAVATGNTVTLATY